MKFICLSFSGYVRIRAYLIRKLKKRLVSLNSYEYLYSNVAIIKLLLRPNYFQMMYSFN
jgi:hypothetical protein